MLASVLYVPAAVYYVLTGLGRPQTPSALAVSIASPQDGGMTATSVLADASERPIMTGIVSADDHDKAE